MIPHNRPTLDLQDAASVQQVLRGGQIAMGPRVSAFEAAFAARQGVPAAAVSSGTAALHLSLLALGVKKGDEVIIPTHVCTALLNVVHYVGATPVLADADLADANISAADVHNKITRRTRAVIVPHMFGFPADLAPLLRPGVPVIEDGAQALGARYAGKPVGSWGRISAFSFYATKIMATGEGGMVASRDEVLVARVRDLLSYDHKADYKVRFNYKLTDVAAALGLSQLKKLNGFISRRNKIAAFYDESLKGIPCILPMKQVRREPVYYRYVIRVQGGADKFTAAMKAKGVCCERPLFRPLHQYLKQRGFPVSDQWMKEAVSLPVYPSMTQDDVSRVVRGVRALLARKGGCV